MRRTLFNLATAASLALFAVAAGLWVRGWFVQDYLMRADFTPESSRLFNLNVHAGLGRLSAVVTWQTLSPETLARVEQDLRQVDGRWRHVPQAPQRPASDALNYRLFRFREEGSRFAPAAPGAPRTGREYLIGIRLGFLAALSAVLPALWLRAAIRHRRKHRHGLCPACGYDLRESLSRCPECGRSFKPPVQPM